MATDYPHFDGLEGRSNVTGFKDQIFVAPKSYFDTLQEAPAVGVNPGDTVTITATHTFTGTNGFIRMKMTQDTVELLSEVTGDNADSLGSKITLNAFLPGLYAPELELNKCLRNEDLVILVQDCNGITWQIGCDCSCAKARPAVQGGKQSGGVKGTNWEFMAFCDLKVYEGTITEKA